VIGVPSNDFNQESGDNRAVREFCDTMYGITFPMAALSHVRGPNANPLHAWLASRAGGPPRWNFHKYLVGKEGAPFAPSRPARNRTRPCWRGRSTR
jgi:glutathione peroxidase